MISQYNVADWCAANEHLFVPPVCNKLMHKIQLSVMFIGGPNERKDFHLDEGSEFFFMLKGDMTLPTVQQGKRVDIKIKEGEVFLLPSRIPHSPQRTASSLGLVIERSRIKGPTDDLTEWDGLRWYTDDSLTEVLWEKYFYCDDLGRDLVPVVLEFKASDEFKTNVPTGSHVHTNPPLKQDFNTVVPPPFNLNEWIKENSSELGKGNILNLFSNHPDKEFQILIAGGPNKTTSSFKYETWLYQLKGAASIEINGKSEELNEGECCIIPSNTTYTISRPEGSLGMVVTQNPTGNKPQIYEDAT